MTKKKHTKKVRAWAIVGDGGRIWQIAHGDSHHSFLLAVSSSRDEAITVKCEEMIEGERVIPCTITYSLPKKP